LATYTFNGGEEIRNLGEKLVEILSCFPSFSGALNQDAVINLFRIVTLHCFSQLLRALSLLFSSHFNMTRHFSQTNPKAGQFGKKVSMKKGDTLRGKKALKG
jgi:hypothetical protein